MFDFFVYVIKIAKNTKVKKYNLTNNVKNKENTKK